MLQKGLQYDMNCDACNGTRYIGVERNGEGFDLIECEKCHGTGRLLATQFRFTDDEEEE